MNEQEQNELVQQVAEKIEQNMLLYQAINEVVEGLDNEREARQVLARHFVAGFPKLYEDM